MSTRRIKSLGISWPSVATRHSGHALTDQGQKLISAYLKIFRKLLCLNKTLLFYSYITILDSILVYIKFEELIQFDKEKIGITMFYGLTVYIKYSENYCA